MLGIPIISVVGKTNADLLLPPELLLPRCDRALLGDGSVVALDAAVRKTLDAELESFASQALRVLALAYDHDKRGDFDKVRSPAEVPHVRPR